MNRFRAVGMGLVGFGAILAGFSYLIIASVPLTTLKGGEKVVFCSDFINETRFINGSDKSDRYNMGVFHHSPRHLL